MWLHHKPFDNTDMDFNTIGTLKANDIAVRISQGKKINLSSCSLSVGGNVNYISTSLASYSSSGLGFDFGGIAKFNFLKFYSDGENDNFSIGLSLMNAGFWFKSNNNDPSLPSSIRLGIGYTAFRINQHTIDMGIAHTGYFIDKLNAYNAGIEYNFKKLLFIRCGSIMNKAFASGFSIGFGLEQPAQNIKCSFNIIKGILKNYYFSKIIVVFQDICPVWGSTCKVIRDPLRLFKIPLNCFY